MKRILSFLTATVIILSIFSSNFSGAPVFAEGESFKPVQIGVNENTPAYQKANYEEVAENGYLTMYADEKGWFCIKNNETGYIWYSHPNDSLIDKKTIGINKRNFQSECIVYYVYKDDDSETSSYAEASINSNSLIQSDWVKTEKVKNGIKVTYDFYPICARITVSYVLKGKTFIATIIGKETLEGKAFKKAVKDTLTDEQKSVMQTSYITSIWLLPTFGAGNSEESGFVFVPDGCGAYMDYKPASHITEITNIPVYGKELSIDEYGIKNKDSANITRGAQAYIPAFGIAREHDGLLATIKSGDATASINAYKAGTSNSYTGVSAQMNISLITYARIGSKTVQGIAKAYSALPNFSITYDFLSADSLSYAHFANALREKWVKSGKIKKQKFNPSLDLRIIGAIDVDSHFLGFPTRSIKALTTVRQAEKIVSTISKKSVNVSVNYIGWNNNGFQNSKITNSAKPNGAVGKVAHLESLAKKADSLYLDADLITFKRSGNGIFKNSSSAKTAFDQPVLVRKFSYSTFDYENAGVYLLSPGKFGGIFEKYIKSFNKLPDGIGASFNNIGNSCYSNFGVNSYSRVQTANNYLKALSAVRQKLSFDRANAYVFPFAERIFNAPDCSSRQRIYDGEIPFYQMLLHGYVAVTSPYLNQCANKGAAFLRAVETGSELCFMVMYADSSAVNDTDYSELYGTTFSMLKSDILNTYGKYSKLLEKISDRVITDYIVHNKDVTETVYENNIRVFVNYSDTDYKTGDITVPANGFTYTKG
ncbi:MAG: hypothetical protein J5662_08935 [Clostridia bacterium]|nr:hypothetical protein [Clostridia bacterium]